RIYVVSKGDNKNLSNADLQAGSALTKDYKEIILSDEVLEETISDLKLESTLESLASKIKISIPAETRIISISVTNTNSDEAARIANGIR
ncbi:Wzz/FepE/Etk N-terminal domain-containing protein, partial [Streptococcus pneumoniae]